jgi:hypothetical protein
MICLSVKECAKEITERLGKRYMEFGMSAISKVQKVCLVGGLRKDASDATSPSSLEDRG